MIDQPSLAKDHPPDIQAQINRAMRDPERLMPSERERLREIGYPTDEPGKQN